MCVCVCVLSVQVTLCVSSSLLGRYKEYREFVFSNGEAAVCHEEEYGEKQRR